MVMFTLAIVWVLLVDIVWVLLVDVSMSIFISNLFVGVTVYVV
jgi:hypothetical protein